ncbi:ATP synthase F1 subunit gamma [Candidatus Roizmanbacteria bacterium RIFCSPHIGHO2_02_FULL_40_9]|uniref:ATP synthase gamma chain n=2 Tax=Candidatus Roizmaniibacteriota TaxID=1752723 RepID=A0A1F7ILH5_9BACT|nr:MAG: ATP synthase F1 subunit gamma [Candidatus Roizmanbacteria bacterium RIFCSPHIGHO2_02_FULL_40_9]OGK44140.1 MAG: ATP synthase F1 subunit gamma [Candidatus Roizmanbacteria bacterium RIFCSPLOWO2_01_FULL_38_11]
MNFRQVRKKIKTVENVKKITNAMQMVSAVKMKKAQKLALEGREYRSMLDAVLQKIISNTSDLKGKNIPWLAQYESDKSLYIVISSNKGLCGAFHAYLLRFVLENINEKKDEFITVGNKGSQFLGLIGATVIADFSQNLPFIDSVSSIFSLIQEKYITGSYKNVYLIYNKFVSSFKFEPTKVTLLPISEITSLEGGEQTKEAKELSKSDYLIEPSVDEILLPLINDYLREKIRSAISDSEASEHSARMMAMKSATDNATELVFTLTLLRNKLRQSQITGELLDMVAAKTSSESSN